MYKKLLSICTISVFMFIACKPKEEEKKEEVSFSKNDEIENTDESNKITRKDQKRLEAEKRQKFHKATKDLKSQIKSYETEIEKFENLKTNLELDMMKEEVYSNPVLAKQNKFNYDKVKNDLENLYMNWTQSGEELERILEEINDE